jgi:hypothetical protein
LSARGFGAIGASLLGAAQLLACHGEQAEARRAEAARISRSIDALRSAPNDGKAPLAKALSSEPCSFDDVCGLRDACVHAYQAHVGGLDSLRIARRAAENDSGPTAKIAELAQTAEDQLARAKHEVERCADRQAELVRRYEL